MTAPDDHPAIEPCADCNSPSETTAYAGHVREPDGTYRRVDLPSCLACALENEQERAWKARTA